MRWKRLVRDNRILIFFVKLGAIMYGVAIDIGLCLVTYAILIRIIVWRKHARRNKDNDNDDEGGLPVYNGPQLDLPPGVCLPAGPYAKPIREKELV